MAETKTVAVPEDIQKAVQKIVALFNPRRVILFEDYLRQGRPSDTD